MFQPVWLDAAMLTRHRRRNLVQTLLIVAGMVGLLSLIGWLVAGEVGVMMALGGGAASLAFSPRLSPGLVLRLYRARPLAAEQVPALYEVLAAIARRAELPRVPRLYYLPSASLNAIAVGRPAESAIALTDGILRRLDLRELAGVLAHEVSHLANRDLLVMGLGEMVVRLTRLLSTTGLVLLMISLPAFLAEGALPPLLLIGLLVFAPTLGVLLQLALARTREFDADGQAVALTGDPEGLAAALAKLERFQGRRWEEIFLPMGRGQEPSWLRTHPETAERIRRLLEMRAPAEPIYVGPWGGLPDPFAPVGRGWPWPSSRRRP